MKALKAFVIGMGLLILLLLGVLGYGLYRNSRTLALPKAAPAAAAKDGQPYHLALPLEPGAVIEQLLPDGGLLIVKVKGPAGDQILVVDPGQGRILGSIAPAP